MKVNEVKDSPEDRKTEDGTSYNQPLVSVCMITYNHERYIAQAIESVLMQTTDFNFELVIGEDCSTDTTGEICERYARKYPETICLLRRKENLGISANFIETLDRCRGKYIAICEGDDYWIDPKKLQIQADLLSKYPDIVLCVNADRVEEVDGSVRDRPLRDAVISIEDIVPMILRREFLPTVGWMFRRSAVPAIPTDLREVFFDIILLMLLASNGKVMMMNRIMSVYRLHPNNWTNSQAGLTRLEFLTEAIDRCRKYLYPAAYEQLTHYLASCYADAAFFAFEDTNLPAFQKNFRNALRLKGFLNFRTKAALLIRWLVSRVALLERVFRQARKRVRS